MKNALAAFSLLALLGAGCFTRTDTTVQVIPNKPSPAVEGDSAAMLLEGKNAINVDGQRIGGMVLVSLAVLEKPGYVVIHADANGAPGKIIGNSALLQAGENRNVQVASTVENDNQYWAMIHIDNGDGKYVTADDAPIKDGTGNIIMMKFEGFVEGELMEPVADLKVNLDAKINVDTNAKMEVKTFAVAIEGFAFSQKSLTVKKGSKVVFTNKDSVKHNAAADAGAFKGPLIAQGESWTLDTSTLAAGSYAYHCEPHPNMKATLIVSE